MKSSRVLLTILLIVSPLFLFCGKPKAQQEIADWVKDGALVVDVRSPEEYAQEHFPGAVNIPIDSVSSRLDEFGGKDRKIVLYCRSGGRSARAASILEKEGFTGVKDAGGIRNLFDSASKN